jgi:hypothetical protein
VLAVWLLASRVLIAGLRRPEVAVGEQRVTEEV